MVVVVVVVVVTRLTDSCDSRVYHKGHPRDNHEAFIAARIATAGVSEG
jgi:hypothetical protein